VQLGDAHRLDPLDGVHCRPECPQGTDEVRSRSLVAHVDDLDDGELAAPNRLGDLLERRELEDPADGSDLVGDVGRPLVPRVQHLGRALPREEEHAGVDVRDRVQLHLEGGDDAEAPAAAAQRPEQVAVVVGVDATQLSVSGDELDGGDAVGRQPELAGVPADSPAERVAGDADVRRGAVQRGEAEIGCPRDDVGPSRARRDPGDPALDVDLDPLERVGLDQDLVVHLAQRLGVVPGALGRDLQAVGPRELDGRDHVGLVGGDDDERGLLDDGRVERLRRSVPSVPARLDHSALEAVRSELRAGTGATRGFVYATA
jgi:hypothetical protein